MKENSIENSREKIPTEQEVLEVISRFAENATFVRELSDNNGLYLLEVKVESEKPGEFTEYQYIRKGIFPNRNQALETTVYATYYQDGIPISGHNVAHFDPETEGWQEVK